MRADSVISAEQLRSDKLARQRRIRGSLWFTAPGTCAALGLAYWLVPPLAGLAEPGERLILATRWLLIAFVPYAAVCLTILLQRYAEGAHNPLLGQESEGLRVHSWPAVVAGAGTSCPSTQTSPCTMPHDLTRHSHAHCQPHPA